jgi:hypothetical protein
VEALLTRFSGYSRAPKQVIDQNIHSNGKGKKYKRKKRKEMYST